jgi:hypothetical protein
MDFFFVYQPDVLGHLTARGLLYECVSVTPSFLHVALTCRKHASVRSPLDLPLVSILTFLEGVLASLDFGQVGGSPGINIALSSLRAPGPTLQRLDVHLRTH